MQDEIPKQLPNAFINKPNVTNIINIFQLLDKKFFIRYFDLS